MSFEDMVIEHVDTSLRYMLYALNAIALTGKDYAMKKVLENCSISLRTELSSIKNTGYPSADGK